MYEVMEDVEFPQIAVGDPAVIPWVIAAAQALVKQGARAVVGACGSLGHYQKPVAEAIREPVYMSMLTQVPFILQSLGSNQKLLLVFATLGAFTDMVKDQCGIEDTDRLLAIDLVNCEEIRRLNQPNVEIRMDKLLDEVAASIEIVMNDDIGAVLFQCSDLPPIAFDLQQRIGLPVFDMTGIIRWLDSCVVRQPFSGHL